VAKGADWERQLCKEFSLWWTDGKRDDIFWRTSNSGGRATMRGKKSTSGQYGDMGFIDPIGKPLIDFCTFEFKRGYPRAVLHDFFDDPVGNSKSVRIWEKWICKARAETIRADTHIWMIVHRRNRREPLVVTTPNLISLLGIQKEFSRSIVPKLKAEIWARPNSSEKHSRITVIGFGLDDFFMYARPGKIKNLGGG